ncbi:MAG: hypothetical protein H5T62_12260, partial [Anaerolineae bacterium]|nr:hypothetical protein [Anaerolineae bacterium]
MSKRISSCRLFLILLSGGLLLVVVCCLCSTRRAKEEPLPPNVEVVADTASFKLSPDGRRAAMNLGQLVIKDFADGTETPVKGEWTNWAWLNESLLFVRGGGSIVVDVRDLSQIPLQEIKVEFLNAAGTRMEVDESEEERLRTVLQQAEQVYVIDGHTIIALAQDFKSPSATSYVASPSRMEREKILEGIPYIEVLPLWASCPGKVFSHNGEMYGECASYSDGYYETGTLSIYTKDGELLIEVSRKGYCANPFGWA